jgi:ABC-type sugar transport system ATPase subunit
MARPADTFVATFIGSPVMNLLPGHVVREVDRSWFRSQDIALDLGDVASDLQGSQVKAGIRPEDLKVTQDPAVQWKARVDMRSNVGAHSYLHVRTGKMDLTIRVAKGTPYRSGDIIGVDLDVSKIHVFHGDRRVQWSRYSE